MASRVCTISVARRVPRDHVEISRKIVSSSLSRSTSEKHCRWSEDTVISVSKWDAACLSRGSQPQSRHRTLSTSAAPSVALQQAPVRCNQTAQHLPAWCKAPIVPNIQERVIKAPRLSQDNVQTFENALGIDKSIFSATAVATSPMLVEQNAMSA